MRAAALSVAVLLLLACSDSTAPNDGNPGVVALVSFTGTKPNLFIQNIDGGGTQRIHFTGATDPIPGNSPLVPPVTDENLLALGNMTWSPDGSKLALTATVAFDQSEVIVINRDGGAARVASVNQQIILSDIDWSPDQRYLAYAMSTQPAARGVELFTTDLQQNTVRKLTTGSNFGGTGAALRLSPDASKVYFSRAGTTVNTPVYNHISELRSADLNGTVQLIGQGIVGEISAIARDGSWVLLLRNTALRADGSYDRQLVKRNLVSGEETILVGSGKLQSAEVLPGDQSVLVIIDTSADPASQKFSLGKVSIEGGAVSYVRGIDESVSIVAVHPAARIN